jgi:hypothetical protein
MVQCQRRGGLAEAMTVSPACPSNATLINGECDKAPAARLNSSNKQTAPATLCAGSRCLTSVSEFEVEPGSNDTGIIADEVGRVAEV